MAAKGQLIIDAADKAAKYSNVDFSKWIVDKNGCRKFLCSCLRCNKEKGYVREAQYSKNCKSCNGYLSKAGKPSSQKGTKTNRPAWNRGCFFNPLKKRLRNRMSTRMRHALRGRNLSKKWQHVFNILGYSVDDLKNHLENKFTNGMTWDNIGKWHIDHIYPESKYNYLSFSDEDFKKCWALSNLQPLWAKDNIRKSNKLEGDVSFQVQ